MYVVKYGCIYLHDMHIHMPLDGSFACEKNSFLSSIYFTHVLVVIDSLNTSV